MRVTSRASVVEVPGVQHQVISQAVLDLHDQLNKNPFAEVIEAPAELVPFAEIIVRQFKSNARVAAVGSLQKFSLHRDDKKVCLGFSCGLDSVAQAVYLSESGYNVACFNMKGVNTYENAQADKRAAQIIAKIPNVSLVQASIKKCSKKSCQFKQQWPENPMKNQMILAFMLDWCIENGCNKISLGDDFDLDIADAVPGINLTDAKQITLSFLEALKTACQDIEFLKIDSSKHNKLDRIKTLMSKGLQDDFYSCVAPGRFNRSFHERNQTKFGVDVFNGNCGCSCRKCSMHNLLLHYGNVKKFPQDFIDACWKKMYDNAHSADYEFFKPELPLEKRIQNLFSY